MTPAVASRNMHLVATTHDRSAVPTHTLCGRAVTEVVPPLVMIETGCPACALEAIAMGVEVAQDRDGVYLRLPDDTRFVY